jgi:hypothetical protein
MSVEEGKETTQLIPGAKLLIIDGTGHDMPKEVWSRTINAISKILQCRPQANGE